MEVIPINIRPHLVPFLMKEFDGIEAHYLNRKVKACKINKFSSLGFIFHLLLEKSKFPQNIEKFKFFFAIDTFSKNSKTGTLYKIEDGKTTFLKVSEKHAIDFNNVLENLFRTSFIYYVNGYVSDDPTRQISDAIGSFMVKYELDEHGYNLATLRKLYDRYKSGNTLKRYQNKPSNRVIGYL